MLEIETRLSIAPYLQINKQIEWINELEQYLRFFIEYRQRDQLELEFVVNNKVHLATKVLSFIVNYSRELKIGIDIKSKEKVKKVFAERIRKVQKEIKAILKKHKKR